MLKRALCILALLSTFPASRPCFSIPEIPAGKDQIYRISNDSMVTDSAGLRLAFVLTLRTIRYTGTAFLVYDSMNVMARNSTPQHIYDVFIKRDSVRTPPRELDFCSYADSIDTVMAYEDDSLYIAFVPGVRGRDAITVVFSLKEGLLYHNGTGETRGLTVVRMGQEAGKKADFARSYENRQSGIFRADRWARQARSRGMPGFAFGIARFDACGRRIASGRSE